MDVHTSKGIKSVMQACFLCTFWRPSRPNRASYPWVFFPILEFFCPNLKGFWYNSWSFWQSFSIFSWKTVRKQVAIVGKLQVCHFLQQIIASRLKFYTTRFWIGPHNFEFLEKKSLSFWPKAKTLSYFGLEFFQKCTKNKPVLVPFSEFGTHIPIAISYIELLQQLDVRGIPL